MRILLPPKDKFIELIDTPASYSGQGGKFTRVVADETGLEFGTVVFPSFWELIRTGVFTDNVNIIELSGNIDKMWMLLIRTRHTLTHRIRLRFNADATAGIYHNGIHWAGSVGGVIVHGATTFSGSEITLSQYFWRENFAQINIASLSGQIRMVRAILNGFAPDYDLALENFGGHWLNTVANITTINIITGTITAGEYWLFRPKP